MKMPGPILVLFGCGFGLLAGLACGMTGAQPSGKNIRDHIPPADQIRPKMSPRFVHASTVAPTRLRCDWLRNPLGVQDLHPRLTRIFHQF